MTSISHIAPDKVEWDGRSSIENHLLRFHDFTHDEETACLWDGCSKTRVAMNVTNMARHLASHIGRKVICTTCTVVSLREDACRRSHANVRSDCRTMQMKPFHAGAIELNVQGIEHFYNASFSLGLALPSSLCYSKLIADYPSYLQRTQVLQDLTKYITKVEDYPVARGGFGEIWKCVYLTDQGLINVAVKSLLMYAFDQFGGVIEKKEKRIQRELRTCARLKHANILAVYGYTYGFGRFMAIVSPWAEKGDLTAFLEQEDATLTLVRRFEILRDIAAGLQYLHANNVIHGDLTGPNVLIHGDGTACLADFGLSLMYSDVASVSQASWTSAFHGNFRWLAPELLGQQEDDLPIRPSMLSDIYSFGGIMLQVFTSKIPYYYTSEAVVIRCIYTGEKPLRSRYPPLSNVYWHFIERCWSGVESRPLAKEAVEWIRDEFDLLSRSSTAT